MIDTLPELATDSDVDALMNRLRGKLAQPEALSSSAAPATSAVVPAPASDDPLRDFLAAQEELNAVVVRALRLVSETLGELNARVWDEAPPAAVTRVKPRPLRPRQARARKSKATKTVGRARR